MAAAKDETTEAKTGEGGEGGEKKPPEAKADPPKQDAKTTKPAEAETPKPDAKAAAKPKETDVDDDTDLDALKDDERLSLSKKALDARLKRASKAALRDAFGTDDIEKIKADIKESAELKKKAEEQRRAELSENEKLKEDLSKAQKEAEEAKAALARFEEASTADRQNRAIRSIARGAIDPDALDLAVHKFAAYVDGLSDKEAEKLAAEDVQKWFAKWAEEHPKYAKAAADAKADDKPVAKKGIDNGPKGDPPPKKPAGSAQKSVKDMSRKEFQEYARANGIDPSNV